MKPLLIFLIGGLVVIGLAAAAAAQSVGSPTMALARQDATAGAAIYQANCAVCHQANGSGIQGAFPPLAGNSRAADAAYVASVVRAGLTGAIEVDGVTYNGVMPPVALSDAEIADVAAYVATLGGGAEPPTTTIPAVTTGDAGRGENLFTGVTTLANGGAACHACHAASDVGFRGGRGLGPDLTDVFTRLGGEAGLAAWLSAPASVTMQPIFTDKPLTTGEIADLAAFLGTTIGQPTGGGFDQVLITSGLGLLALLGLMALVIRGPNETYTQRLRRKP